MELYTTNQVCAAIGERSVDQAVMHTVWQFQREKQINPDFVPQKVEITKHADRLFNRAVSAFLSLQ